MRHLWQRYRIFDQFALESEDRLEREPDRKDEEDLQNHRRACYLRRKREEEEGIAIVPDPKPAPNPKPPPRPEPTPDPKPRSYHTAQTKYKRKARITSPRFDPKWTNVTTDILGGNERELHTGFGTFTLKAQGWYLARDGYWYELHPEPIESIQVSGYKIDMSQL